MLLYTQFLYFVLYRIVESTVTVGFICLVFIISVLVCLHHGVHCGQTPPSK